MELKFIGWDSDYDAEVKLCLGMKNMKLFCMGTLIKAQNYFPETNKDKNRSWKASMKL